MSGLPSVFSGADEVEITPHDYIEAAVEACACQSLDGPSESWDIDYPIIERMACDIAHGCARERATARPPEGDDVALDLGHGRTLRAGTRASARLVDLGPDPYDENVPTHE